MKYLFIDENRSKFRLERMCHALDISRSGYYHWRKRGKSSRQLCNEYLLDKIKIIFYQSRERYGSPRVWAELRAQGIMCSRKRVARLMKQAGLVSKRSRKYKLTTCSKHSLPIAPNLLNQNFAVQKPDYAWVSDITYIWTREGWLYLAVILDLFSRQVVGWSISSRMTKELVVSAIKQAIDRRNPARGLIFHSDRGSQYASHEVRNLLAKYLFLQSMSKKGDCYDNAVAEAFFANLKTELVYPYFFSTKEQAIREIFEYIEIFYNRQRRHSYLKYFTPASFEIADLVA